MLSKVWPKGKIALTILVAFLASCEGVIFAYLFKVVIEALHDHQLQELKTTILIVLGLYAVLILFYYLFNRLKNDFVRSFNYYYKTEIVAHYFTAPTLFRDRYGEKVVSFLLNDLKQVETTYSKVFFDLFFYIFFALTSLIYSLYLDYRLSLILPFSLSSRWRYLGFCVGESKNHPKFGPSMSKIIQAIFMKSSLV